MKKKTIGFMIVISAAMISAAFSGCGKQENEQTIPETTETVELVIGNNTVSTDDQGTISETDGISDTDLEGREDGERFEGTIIIEGMEETVNYEHIKNTSLGFEMDYDHEMFTRSSGSDSERIISVYDDMDDPDYYLEITKVSDDVESAASSIGAALSNEYDIDTESFTLDNAGACTRIEASIVKGTNQMAEKLQVVYIIPADDGSLIVTAHYYIEGAEGFGRRFSYMINTIKILNN